MWYALKMKNAIILHGTGGTPQSNWFLWLQAELEKQGMHVWLPELPNTKLPSLAGSTAFVQQNAPFAIDEETLIIGHSSGAILALIIAQQNQTPVGGVVGVSVFCDNSLGWDANNKLFDVDFDWPNIRANVKKLLFIHSDNDPYVPLEKAKFVADNCQAELLVWPGQGHFNLEQGPHYAQFPKLLETMRQKGFLA